MASASCSILLPVADPRAGARDQAHVLTELLDLEPAQTAENDRDPHREPSFLQAAVRSFDQASTTSYRFRSVSSGEPGQVADPRTQVT